MSASMTLVATKEYARYDLIDVGAHILRLSQRRRDGEVLPDFDVDLHWRGDLVLERRRAGVTIILSLGVWGR